MKTPVPFVLALIGAASAFAAADPAQLAAARALFREPAQAAAAERAYEKIAATDPQCLEAEFSLAELALRRDDAERAVVHAEKAVALAPDDGPAHHALGDAYGLSAQKASVFSQFGLAKKCLAQYQRAIELAPANVDFHASLFEYYRQAPGIVGGGTDKALAEAAVILKLDPLRGHNAYVTLLVADKKYDEARIHSAEIKKLDPAQGRQSAASVYVAEKKYDLALAEFDAALQASPDDYNALYQLGRFAATTGQFLDRGLAALRRSLELPVPVAPNMPSHAGAQWRIGNILEKKGDPAGARAAYQAALQLDPKFYPAADSLKKLK
jgi:tetratricopeptide (TPR) repeat protein